MVDCSDLFSSTSRGIPLLPYHPLSLCHLKTLVLPADQHFLNGLNYCFYLTINYQEIINVLLREDESQ